MKVAVIAMLVCAVGVDSNINNFFSMLGDGVQVQFQNAWDVMKQFIKRPVRHKKVQQHKVERTTYSYLETSPEKYVGTTTTTELTTKEYTMPPDMMYYFQRPKHKMVILPIIEIPKWKTWGDWMDMQQPNLGFVYRGGVNFQERGMKKYPYNILNNHDFYGDVTTVRQLDDEDDEEDDDENVGVMMFV